MTRIILINGEPKVGKSTFAKDLRDSLNYGWAPSIAERFSLVAPVHMAVFGLYEYTKAAKLSWVHDELTHVKESVIAGITGRNWMISLGDAFRTIEPDIFIHIFIEHFKNLINPIEYAIIDNWGFANELSALMHYAPSHWVIDTIYMDQRATRAYRMNEQFDNDNRIALPHLAEWINPTVREYADYLQPAIHHDKIEEQFDFGHKIPSVYRDIDLPLAIIEDATRRAELNPTRRGLTELNDLVENMTKR